jgi:hypothetical protein
MLGIREGVIPDAEFKDMLKRWSEFSFPEDEITSSFFEKYQKDFNLI